MNREGKKLISSTIRKDPLRSCENQTSPKIGIICYNVFILISISIYLMKKFVITRHKFHTYWKEEEGSLVWVTLKVPTYTLVFEVFIVSSLSVEKGLKCSDEVFNISALSVKKGLKCSDAYVLGNERISFQLSSWDN